MTEGVDNAAQIERERRSLELLDSAAKAWQSEDYAECERLLLHEWAEIWAGDMFERLWIPDALLARFYKGWDMLNEKRDTGRYQKLEAAPADDDPFAGAPTAPNRGRPVIFDSASGLGVQAQRKGKLSSMHPPAPSYDPPLADDDPFAGAPESVDRRRPMVQHRGDKGAGVSAQRKGHVGPNHPGLLKEVAADDDPFAGAPESPIRSRPHIPQGAGNGMGVQALRKGWVSPSQPPAASSGRPWPASAARPGIDLTCPACGVDCASVAGHLGARPECYRGVELQGYMVE